MDSKHWQLTEEDIQVIALQIGRQPRAVLGVACHCPHNYPLVVVSEPVFFNEEKSVREFFPTTYWLSCRRICKQVSRLEGGGLIARLEGLIARNLYLREMLEEAHSSYIHQRFGLVGRNLFTLLQEEKNPILDRLLNVGIAGVENFRHLKCLHAHIAQQLAIKNNPIGEMILRLLVAPYCEPNVSNCQSLFAEL